MKSGTLPRLRLSTVKPAPLQSSSGAGRLSLLLFGISLPLLFPPLLLLLLLSPALLLLGITLSLLFPTLLLLLLSSGAALIILSLALLSPAFSAFITTISPATPILSANDACRR
jgi:hypothetical protein